MGGGGDSMDAIFKAIQRIKTARMEAKTAEIEAKLEAMTQELAKRSSAKKAEELLTSKEIASIGGQGSPLGYQATGAHVRHRSCARHRHHFVDGWSVQ